MICAQRLLPFTKQLVLLALFDVLDAEHSVYEKTADGGIRARVTVYGNPSGFAFAVCDAPPATALTVDIPEPWQGLTPQGQRRAVQYLADRVEQLLENELNMGTAWSRETTGRDPAAPAPRPQQEDNHETM